MFYFVYKLVGWLLFFVVFPFFLLYVCFTGKHRQGLGQRLGFYPDLRVAEDKSIRIWLHAASVGEVQVARALISQIHKQLPRAAIILSTVTRQGHAVATNQMPDDVCCIFAPLDLCGIVNRALKAIRPDFYICLETELWPNMLFQARKSGVTLLLLNGRMSENSYAGYAKAKGFMQKLLACFAQVAVIQEADAQRYRALGVATERLHVAGNAKYDLTAAEPNPLLAERYRKWLGIHSDQPVLVAGSTHGGEEALLLDVLPQIQQRLPDLVLVLVPRHLRRLAELSQLFKEKGAAFQLLSRTKEDGRTSDIILVDTMGELAGLYSVATFVFCGGSLVERGGHNVLEAAVWGKPVFYGPSMKDFLDAKNLLESAEAGFPVRSAQELAEKIRYFADHPQEFAMAGRRAGDVAASQAGAAQRQIDLLRKTIDRKPQ